MRMPPERVVRDATYMKEVGLPDVLDSVLSVLLKKRPPTTTGILHEMIATCQTLLQDFFAHGPAEPPDAAAAFKTALQSLRASTADVAPEENDTKDLVSTLLTDVSDIMPGAWVARAAAQWSTSKLLSEASTRRTGDRSLLSAHPVYKVVLTGGPCAGKSTGMSVIRTRLEANGFDVLIVPEAATMLFDSGAGIAFRSGAEANIFVFQQSLMRLQMRLEDELAAIASCSEKPVVMLCDRGIMDGKAFCAEDQWKRILREGGWTDSGLRDSNYDLVLHLVTAADGAASYYTYENNAARTETPKEAIEQDVKLREAWKGHRNHIIIDNSTDFEKKIERVVQRIMKLVGLGDLCVFTKFEVTNPPDVYEIDVPADESTETVHILRGSNTGLVDRICRRCHETTVTYTRQILRRGDNIDIYRVEKRLTESAYETLLEGADPSFKPVEKRYVDFEYKGTRFELAWKSSSLSPGLNTSMNLASMKSRRNEIWTPGPHGEIEIGSRRTSSRCSLLLPCPGRSASAKAHLYVHSTTSEFEWPPWLSESRGITLLSTAKQGRTSIADIDVDIDALNTTTNWKCASVLFQTDAGTPLH